jgi:hypothetical protein
MPAGLSSQPPSTSSAEPQHYLGLVVLDQGLLAFGQAGPYDAQDDVLSDRGACSRGARPVYRCRAIAAVIAPFAPASGLVAGIASPSQPSLSI